MSARAGDDAPTEGREPMERPLGADSRYGSELGAILGSGGPLARRLAGFAPRREQQDMAQCVSDALARLEPLVIEAGTGTGKTFAYLVPALLSGRHVIISTGTKNLQDQLYRRDLPELAAALGRPVKIALLKGRANYLCWHRLKMVCAAPEQQMFFDTQERRGGAAVLRKIEQWSQRSRYGDISEVTDVKEDDAVWAAVTSTRENCLGQDCPEYSRCHVAAARRAAQAAEVVIVNHHLLLADLALKEGGFGELLPGTEAVILDEAHQAPHIAAQFFGASLGSRPLLNFARDTLAELNRAGLTAVAASAALEELQALVRTFRSELPPGRGAAQRMDWNALGHAGDALLEEAGQRLQDLAELLKNQNADAGVEHCARRAAELALRCQSMLAADQDLGVRWAEVRMQNWNLHYTPFEVADKFRQFIDAAPCAWIFTSATLAVGEDFSHFNARVGLSQARTVRIASPFDFTRQALLYLPPNMSEPSAPTHTEDVLQRALPLLRAAGGRAFLLFTSHRALSEASLWLKRTLGGEPPFPVLTQGEGSRDALLREFRQLGNAVLLGTGSFWEGVDVKGAALSVVVIDKLPFASPDDPVLAARLEGIRRRGGNPFRDYQIPQAVLALKQGVGRLIRDTEDRGVVMLCDPRLRTRSYGRIFLNSLPPMEITTDEGAVIDFLESYLSMAT